MSHPALILCGLLATFSWTLVRSESADPGISLSSLQVTVVDDKPSAIEILMEKEDPFSCWNWGRLNKELHRRFLSFFENEKTDAFKSAYLKEISKRENGGTFGSILDSSENGLAVTLNNALNVYVIATRPENNRVFQFFQSAWSHFPLQKFFQDFAENSSHPIFQNLTKFEESDIARNSEDFELEYNGRAVALKGSQKIAIFSGKNNKAVNVEKVSRRIKKTEGSEKSFEQKSSFLKAMWNPHPAVKDILKGMWCVATENSSASYLAMYIPFQEKGTTDETWQEEMSGIVEHYINATYDLCSNNNTNCPRNLVIIHQNEQIFRQIRFFLGTDFKTIDMRDLLFDHEFNTEAFLSPIREDLLHYLQPGYVKRDLWQLRNKEMMLSITMLAMAERVACPFSAPVCQLAMLLRGEASTESFLNLDETEISSEV